VERDFGTLQHLQQLSFVGVQTLEQPVESDKTGLAREDAIEPRRESCLAIFGWSQPIGLEVAVEAPNQAADVALGFAVLIGECIKLVNEALGMDPAKAVFTDVKLARIIADDDGIGQQTMGFDAPPQRTLGSDLDRIGVDLEHGDAELFEMRGPCVLVSEIPIWMIGQAGDHVRCQATLAHIGQRRGIDDVVTVASAQKREEVGTVFRVCGAEPPTS
jgi:hypothetical protein